MSRKRIQIQAFSPPPPVKKDSFSPVKIVLVFLFFSTPILLFLLGWFLFQHTSQDDSFYTVSLERFSGPVEFYTRQSKQWLPVTREKQKKILLGTAGRLKTETGEIDLLVEGDLHLRLKEQTEVELNSAKGGIPRIKIMKGVVLGAFNPGSNFKQAELETPYALFNVDGSSFLIDGSKPDQTSAYVLEGQIAASGKNSKPAVKINSYERVTLKAGPDETPQLDHISGKEWQRLNEIRDLRTEPAESEKKISELRLKAGSFFKYVFDEGVFFTPDWGYARRQFYKDRDEGKVLLRIDYDVFPEHSFAGTYMKLRDLDLSKVKRMSFKAWADPGKPPPDEIRIQFKQKFPVKSFSVKPIVHEKRLYSFEFKAEKPTLVSEAVLVFENGKVGPFHTNGTVYIEDFEIA